MISLEEAFFTAYDVKKIIIFLKLHMISENVHFSALTATYIAQIIKYTYSRNVIYSSNIQIVKVLYDEVQPFKTFMSGFSDAL